MLQADCRCGLDRREVAHLPVHPGRHQCARYRRQLSSHRRRLLVLQATQRHKLLYRVLGGRRFTRRHCGLAFLCHLGSVQGNSAEMSRRRYRSVPVTDADVETSSIPPQPQISINHGGAFKNSLRNKSMLRALFLLCKTPSTAIDLVTFCIQSTTMTNCYE